MITLTDAARLAGTKLRARKIRTFVTVLLASLLFGILIAGSLVVTGGFRSVDNFSQDGLMSRYIVGIYPAMPDSPLDETLNNPDLIAEAKRRYEKIIEDKTAEAERLGIRYSQALEIPPYSELSGSDKLRLNLHDSNGIVGTLLEEKFNQEPVIDEEALAQVAKDYNAVGVLAWTKSNIKRGSSLEAYPDGKEIFYDEMDDDERNQHYQPSLIDGNFMTLSPSEIIDPFKLPDNGGWTPDGSSLPIVITQDVAERALGIESANDKSSASEKLEHLKKVRQDIAGYEIRACYRNSASNSLIQQTVRQQKEIKQSANNDDYEEPELIYELPAVEACSSPLIVKDNRSDGQRLLDDNQKQFDEKFGDIEEPRSYFVTFKVVGISPAQPQFNPNDLGSEGMSNLSDVVDNLLRTSGIGQSIPADLYDQLSADSKAKYAELMTYTPNYIFGNDDNKDRFIEFASAGDANRFINEQTCKTQMDGRTCAPAGRSYMGNLMFANSSAIADIHGKTLEWFTYLGIGVIALAAMVMWITIGRTISDGRRETAVFRAIGFGRIDIAFIYTTYVIVLSMLVAGLAAAIGWSVAYLIDWQFSPDLTVKAQYAFGGLDMSKEVSLVGVDSRQVLFMLAACIATGLLSSALPLIRNVRRSPIRDMRDEQ